MKGITAATCDIEHTEFRIWKPLREITRRPAQHTTAAPNFLLSHTIRGRHLGYLIGQQRPQSSPHSVSDASGNSTPVAATLYRLIRTVSICAQTYSAIYFVKRFRS